MVDKMVASRRPAEEDEDFVTRNSTAVFYSVTQSKKEPENATLSSLNCAHETLTKEVELIKYTVGFIDDDKRRWRIVNYDNREGVRATRSCAEFETEGILCKKILYIMRKKENNGPT
ncbi:hypothetical protein RJ640_016773 [Escallonia rubra]|uniref:Protein FAR1-RELATED SEQUENCE n=1 Tax=Escallonia rubra TaxID=112253 RepID=A0AA88QQW1_9ASTE|nr:hypothetical protein RJ640_016773 [Escallonia rubra]